MHGVVKAEMSVERGHGWVLCAHWLPFILIGRLNDQYP